MSRTCPTHVSLFAGCGGSSEGVRQAGFKSVLAVEMDKHAIATYRANHPHTVVDGRSVVDVTADDVLKRTGLDVGELDLLDASPPCPSFSQLGKGSAGWNGDEKLSFEFTRLLGGLRPRAFMMENVPPLAGGEGAGIFNSIFREAVAAGYEVRWKILNAHWYGTPQDRRRLVMIGVRSDVGISPKFPAALPESERKSVRDVLPHIAGLQLTAYKRLIVRDVDRPIPTITKGEMQLTVRADGEDWRKLTVDELKVLCGFPVGYVVDGGYSKAHARLGNSVPPPLSKAVASSLLASMVCQTSCPLPCQGING